VPGHEQVKKESHKDGCFNKIKHATAFVLSFGFAKLLIIIISGNFSKIKV